MIRSVLPLPARRILRIALALTPLLAPLSSRAQAPLPVPHGLHQSPIDIVAAQPDANAAKFGDTSALNNELTLKLMNTTGKEWCKECGGTTVDQRWGSLKALPPEGAKIQIQFDGFAYSLLEFHFHAPAEHLVNGRLTEMEAHYVFKKDRGSECGPDTLLVIAQRIVKGSENAMLNKIFGGIPLPVDYHSKPVYISGFKIGDVMGDPHYQSSYRYPGSLTAPSNDLACPDPPGNPRQQLASGLLPEVVSWVLLQPTIEMSPAQIGRFRSLFPNGDARGPQALHPEVRRVKLAPPAIPGK